MPPTWPIFRGWWFYSGQLVGGYWVGGWRWVRAPATTERHWGMVP